MLSPTPNEVNYLNIVLSPGNTEVFLYKVQPQVKL